MKWLDLGYHNIRASPSFGFHRSTAAVTFHAPLNTMTSTSSSGLALLRDETNQRNRVDAAPACGIVC